MGQFKRCDCFCRYVNHKIIFVFRCRVQQNNNQHFPAGLGPRTPSKSRIWSQLIFRYQYYCAYMPDYTLLQLFILLRWKNDEKLVELVAKDWVRVPSGKNSTLGVHYSWGPDFIVLSMSKSIGIQFSYILH